MSEPRGRLSKVPDSLQQKSFQPDKDSDQESEKIKLKRRQKYSIKIK